MNSELSSSRYIYAILVSRIYELGSIRESNICLNECGSCCFIARGKQAKKKVKIKIKYAKKEESEDCYLSEKEWKKEKKTYTQLRGSEWNFIYKRGRCGCCACANDHRESTCSIYTYNNMCGIVAFIVIIVFDNEQWQWPYALRCLWVRARAHRNTLFDTNFFLRLFLLLLPVAFCVSFLTFYQ